MIELRPVAPDDEEFLCELYHSTRGDEVAAFGWPAGEQKAFLTMQFTMQQNAYKMQYPDAEHSVILCDGVPSGQMMVNRSADELLLTDISVLPEFRHRGIASQLLRQLQTQAAAIVLSVDKQNAAARRLYEKHGFTTTGENELMFTMRWERQ